MVYSWDLAVAGLIDDYKRNHGLDKQYRCYASEQSYWGESSTYVNGKGTVLCSDTFSCGLGFLLAAFWIIPVGWTTLACLWTARQLGINAVGRLSPVVGEFLFGAFL